MTRPVTQAERMIRIETLLEAAVQTREADRQAMHEKIEEMARDIKAIRKDVEADKAELAAFKNKGAGILIGVGLFGTGVGAAVLAALAKVMGWFQ